MIATLADRGAHVNMQLLAETYLEGLSACHRLDKETSGCLLYAKNAEAYRKAAMQFEKREINKKYHAFVQGVHSFNHKEVDLPIRALAKGGVTTDLFKGKPALTFFDTVKSYRTHSLVACQPITGRMHQIRVHLSKLEAPIINDVLYGGQPLYLSALKRNYNLKKWEDEKPLIQRFALHAFQLEFYTFEQRIQVEAPYPKDLRALQRQLDRHGV